MAESDATSLFLLWFRAYLYLSFKEEVDHRLWSAVCSAVLGSDSVVYEECEISSDCLPHGSIDILAGRIGAEHSCDLSIGVAITQPSFQLHRPFGASMKTRTTLNTKELSKYTRDVLFKGGGGGGGGGGGCTYAV